LKNLPRIIYYLILAFFIFLMIRITIPYFSLDDDVSFLKIKQWMIHNQFWKFCFFVHVFTSCFLLFAGFTQFSGSLLRKNKKLHRFIGKTYVIILLFLSAPAGLVMSVFANGGWLSQIAFTSLSVLWIIFTAMAYRTAVKKDFQSHGKFMIRSYALTLSALTLRAWKLGLVLVFHPKPMDVYMIVAWLGWIPNLMIAEWLISKGYHLRILGIRKK
jgi:hypothetical protein